MRRCDRKGHFFLLSFCGAGKPEKGQKSVMIEEFFKIFFKKSLAYGKREDVRNLKMDGKEGIFTTLGISGRYRFPTAIIEASEILRGDFSLLFEALKFTGKGGTARKSNREN